MQKASNPYQYKPLRNDEGSKEFFIRLITLHPGPQTGPITCSISRISLSEASHRGYEALSYCWGNQADKLDIYITPDAETPADQGEVLSVTASLKPFLYRTRVRGQPRTLWIDSICINQSDTNEKDIQVERMRDIYLHAKLTMSWLGPEADSSSEGLLYALDLTKRMRNELADQGVGFLKPGERYDVQVEVTLGHPALEAMMKLLERPYFERAWIVQEVVVSRDAWVVCGETSINWLPFVGGFVYLLENHPWVWEYYSSKRLNTLSSLRVSQKEWEDSKDTEWWKVLLRHRECNAFDPRDKVFAFLGLRCQKELQGLGIVPKYGPHANATFQKLYTRLAFRALEKGQVEILSVPRLAGPPKLTGGEGMSSQKLPSWVPDWRWIEGTPYTLWFAESKNPGFGSPYKATGDSPFDVKFGYDESLEAAPRTAMQSTNESGEEKEETLPSKLYLRGYATAEITELTTHSWKFQAPSGKQTVMNQARILQQNQVQVRAWEAVLFPSNSSAKYQPTANNGTHLWAVYQTLMVGNKLIGTSEDDQRSAIMGFERRQRFLRLIAKAGLHRFVWTYVLVVLVERALRLFGYRNPEMQFRTMVPSMVNRKGAKLKGDAGRQYLGLVPDMCEIGDKVFVFSGVRLPLVLRKRSDVVQGEGVGVKCVQESKHAIPGAIFSSTGYCEWELLGECYVHGMMNGEVWGTECGSVCIT